MRPIHAKCVAVTVELLDWPGLGVNLFVPQFLLVDDLCLYTGVILAGEQQYALAEQAMVASEDVHHRVAERVTEVQFAVGIGRRHGYVENRAVLLAGALRPENPGLFPQGIQRAFALDKIKMLLEG